MKLFVIFALAAVAAADRLPVRSYDSPAVAEARGAPAPAGGYAAPQGRAAARTTARILEQTSERLGEQGFRFRFASDDGIERDEASDAGRVTGSYSYVSPEGVTVLVRYVADALGFRAESDALPTPVPTEYPTPEVPSTEAAPAVRAVLGYSAPAAEQRAAPAPAAAAAPAAGQQYEPVYAYRAIV